jgi:UDP-N-acetylglucosamine diphosphorylase / glucose-1-phosphate thymidylyltransferase / UDP-N-acetylgalactosamine diphosphorylase / glucosamine-1-phosphate N-acetyltransferase / galactosamine-1-phosphate N-acetyltransferase
VSTASPDIFALIRSLWTTAPDHPVAAILPRDPESLREFYPRVRALVSNAPRAMAGRIDSAAIVQGDIVSMGEGSVIEAGAIVHASCRLILGARSIVRAGAVLRDEVVVGDDCLVGVNCEVVRSVLLGPQTQMGHFNYVADSVLGRDVMVAGNVWVANTTIQGGDTVPLVYHDAKIDSGRTHLGLLAGDGARIAASTMICPGCIVLPGITLPPSVTLYGTIDAAKRRALMKHFVKTWVSPETE